MLGLGKFFDSDVFEDVWYGFCKKLYSYKIFLFLILVFEKLLFFCAKDGNTVLIVLLRPSSTILDGLSSVES